MNESSNKRENDIKQLYQTSKLKLCYISFRIQISKQGKKRKLVIDGVKEEDAGKISAQTNADETSCDLVVKRKYIYSCHHR